jgi:uncharacterized membrane protein
MVENRPSRASGGGRPWDLVAVALATLVAAAAVYVRAFPGSAIRIAVVLPLLLFLPGYALVSALYVRAAADRSAVEVRTVPHLDRGLDPRTRVILSVVASAALVPLVALALNFTPYGIRRVPVLAALCLLTVLLLGLAAIRRASLPEAERFAPAAPSVAASGWSVRGDSAAGTALNVVLVASLLLALSATAYALTTPVATGQSFTEFYVLSENESGRLVATDYPRDLVSGQPTQLTVGIENREGEPHNYTVVVLQQRVETRGNETTVLASDELTRIDARVSSGETAYLRHTVAPTMTGEHVRLTYLLYRGDPPANPTAANAYRNLRLYVDVSNASAGGQSPDGAAASGGTRNGGRAAGGSGSRSAAISPAL